MEITEEIYDGRGNKSTKKKQLGMEIRDQTITRETLSKPGPGNVEKYQGKDNFFIFMLILTIIEFFYLKKFFVKRIDSIMSIIEFLLLVIQKPLRILGSCLILKTM